jgi:hypothetical protein
MFLVFAPVMLLLQIAEMSFKFVSLLWWTIAYQ